jgi:hypothetical protein
MRRSWQERRRSSKSCFAIRLAALAALVGESQARGVEATAQGSVVCFEMIGNGPDNIGRFILRRLLAGVPASLVKSREPRGNARRTSISGRNPAGEDALMQVKLIRNVSKLSLSIK